MLFAAALPTLAVYDTGGAALGSRLIADDVAHARPSEGGTRCLRLSYAAVGIDVRRTRLSASLAGSLRERIGRSSGLLPKAGGPPNGVDHLHLDRCLLGGLTLIALGLVLNLWLVHAWYEADWGSLELQFTLRYALWGFTCMVLGANDLLRLLRRSAPYESYRPRSTGRGRIRSNGERDCTARDSPP